MPWENPLKSQPCRPLRNLGVETHRDQPTPCACIFFWGRVKVGGWGVVDGSEISGETLMVQKSQWPTTGSYMKTPMEKMVSKFSRPQPVAFFPDLLKHPHHE